MPISTTRFALPFAISLLVPTFAQGAGSLDAEYRVLLRGLPVGTAGLELETEGARYSVSASGRVNALVKIVSDTELSGKASGRIGPTRLAPAAYRHRWSEDDEEERLDLSFRDGSVADATLTPPPKPRKKIVPVTAEHKRGAVDPLSALVFPADASDGAAVCDRTLPVFDGRQRFDLKLSYSRTEAVGPDDGLSEPGQAVVCAIRYHPVAGHRPGKSSIRFMEENKELEVWMAPVGDSGLMAPLKAKIRTRAGLIRLEARRFSVKPPVPIRDSSVKN